MRKILLSSMLVCAAAFGLNAETIDGIDYTLNADSKTASVVKNINYEGDIVIPSTVEFGGETYTVTEIAYGAFGNMEKEISVVVPNTVETIAGSAFAFNQYYLKSVTLGTGVKKIGSMAFQTSKGFDLYCYAVNPPEIEGYAFNFSSVILGYTGTSYEGHVYVPAESLEKYQNASGWSALRLAAMPSTDVPVESIALDQASFVGAPGSTVQLTATVLPEDATDKTVDWFSDDESVATVDENGLVTLVAVGEATITASPISNDALIATCKITVSNNVGIEGIEAEDGVAEYFNMQGMRVVNPEKGQMVIVRKGGKAFKVVR